MGPITFLGCLVFIMTPPTLQCQDGTRGLSEPSQIHSTLFSVFHKLDTTLDRVELNDIKSAFADPIVSVTRPNRWLVLARGIYTPGNTVSEKLGVFVFDDSLVSILRTIDVIDYAGDYEFTISMVRKDTLTLHAESPGKGLEPFDKKYKLYFADQYRE